MNFPIGQIRKVGRHPQQVHTPDGYLAVLRIAYGEPLAPHQLAAQLNKQGLCTRSARTLVNPDGTITQAPRSKSAWVSQPVIVSYSFAV